MKQERKDILDSLKTNGPSDVKVLQLKTGRAYKYVWRSLKRMKSHGLVRRTKERTETATCGPNRAIWEITEKGLAQWHEAQL